MKEITILSGKGGTGKTSITAALASVAENAVFCDNDVDAADLHLIFQQEIKEKFTFHSGWDLSIDNDLCTMCMKCYDNCRFDAISKDNNDDLHINTFKCEACRLCERICPVTAISSIRKENNYWYISDCRFGDFVHAEMDAGEENSGKLVSKIRTEAMKIAVAKKKSYVINDGPPGIGCATISSLTGADCVLMVIEPSKSGFHDAERLVKLIESFGIKTYAVINKYDIYPEIVESISTFLKSKDIELIAKIPFDKQMVESMINGQTIVEYNKDSMIVEEINNIWNKIK